MNYKYIVVKSTYKIGNTELNSFGIAHIQECDNIPVIFDCIPDISTDMNVIEKN